MFFRAQRMSGHDFWCAPDHLVQQYHEEMMNMSFCATISNGGNENCENSLKLAVLYTPTINPYPYILDMQQTQATTSSSLMWLRSLQFVLASRGPVLESLCTEAQN